LMPVHRSHAVDASSTARQHRFKLQGNTERQQDKKPAARRFCRVWRWRSAPRRSTAPTRDALHHPAQGGAPPLPRSAAPRSTAQPGPPPRALNILHTPGRLGTRSASLDPGLPRRSHFPFLVTVHVVNPTHPALSGGGPCRLPGATFVSSCRRRSARDRDGAH